MLCLALSACSATFSGAGIHADTPDFGGNDLASLRRQRDQLQSRISSARFRRDTQRFGNNAFPDTEEADITSLETRLQDVEQRIRVLEAEGRDAPTSTEEAP